MQYPQEAKAEGIATLVAIPMVAKGKVIGVMRLVDCGTPGVHHGGGWISPAPWLIWGPRPSATPRCTSIALRNSTSRG